MVDFEIGSTLKISPSFSTLKYSPLFPVSEVDAVEIMGVIVLGGSGPCNRGECPQGNGPTGVMVLGG